MIKNKEQLIEELPTSTLTIKLAFEYISRGALSYSCIYYDQDMNESRIYCEVSEAVANDLDFSATETVVSLAESEHFTLIIGDDMVAGW